MDGKKVIEDILNFCREAGDLALKNQKDIKIGFKGNQDIVTETDIAISALAKRHFSSYIDQGHVFIDEEDAPQFNRDYYDDNLEGAEYIWGIDPLDGTHTYALNLPSWGLSVGVMKNGKPWLGVVYSPVTSELLYFDGENPIYVINAFSQNEEKRSLDAQISEIGIRSIFFAGTWDGIHYDFSKVTNLNFYAYVSQILWTLTGKAVGCVFGAHFWDMCGSWPIAKALGFQYFDILDDRSIDCLSADLFKENWKIKNPWLLCRPEHYQELRAMILDYKPF